MVLLITTVLMPFLTLQFLQGYNFSFNGFGLSCIFTKYVLRSQPYTWIMQDNIR